MNFEWDENKNNSNKEKHGVSFEEAKEVFNDDNRITVADSRNDYGELRYIVIGNILKGIISGSIYYTWICIPYYISKTCKQKRTENI